MILLGNPPSNHEQLYVAFSKTKAHSGVKYRYQKQTRKIEKLWRLIDTNVFYKEIPL